MALCCNIRWQGRLARGAVGLILIADAILAYIYDFPNGALSGRLVQLALLAMGSFALFEAAVGWCAFRAMMKTRA